MYHQLNTMSAIANTLYDSTSFQSFCNADATSVSECVFAFNASDEETDDLNGFAILSNGSGYGLTLKTLSKAPVYIESIDVRIMLVRDYDDEITESQNLLAFMQDLRDIIDILANTHCPSTIRVSEDTPALTEKTNNKMRIMGELQLEAPRAEVAQ